MELPVLHARVIFGGEEGVVLCERNTFLDFEIVERSPSMRATASMPPDFKMKALELSYGGMAEAHEGSPFSGLTPLEETDLDSLWSSEPDDGTPVSPAAWYGQEWPGEEVLFSGTSALPQLGTTNGTSELPQLGTTSGASTPRSPAPTWPRWGYEQPCAQAHLQSTGQVASFHPAGSWSEPAHALPCVCAEPYPPAWGPSEIRPLPCMQAVPPSSGFQPHACPAPPVGGRPEWAQSIPHHLPGPVWVVPAVQGTAPSAVDAAAVNAAAGVTTTAQLPPLEAAGERKLSANPRAVFVDLSGLRARK